MLLDGLRAFSLGPFPKNSENREIKIEKFLYRVFDKCRK